MLLQSATIAGTLRQKRQTKLSEFCGVLHYYVPMPTRCKRASPRRRKGMAEREIRRRFERRSWLVWRGGRINMLRERDLYPNVKTKYQRLRHLLKRYHPGTFELLEYACAVHHGMPDFLCYHRARGFLFVECKLEHEQLSARQKKCIRRLQQLGFAVEVHKLVNDPTKIRTARINLETGMKEILERQLHFTPKTAKLSG